MAARSLDKLLDSAPELASLTDHAARLLRLQQCYARTVPGYLAEVSRVANLKLDTLIVHADNAAVAAKLKQLEPSLRAEFGKQGIPLLAIQFKVLPRRPAPPCPTANRDAHLSDGARHALASAADSFADDSPVRAALKRMLANSG